MPHPIVILGPTAVGKSSLAMRLAERLDGEIINADALQVYRGFDIGTAKPSRREQACVAHHLIDILDPHEVYSAGEFARRAHRAIEQIEARGHRPLIVGGSGLYLRALTEGISPMPPGDPRVRAELRRRLEAEGLPALVEELRRIDPTTADRLLAGDRQRVLRALEVAEVSGRPLSAWVDEQPFGHRRLPVVKIGLTLERQVLYDRISVRTDRMISQGWVDEVRYLLAAGLAPELPAFQAIGYRQIVRHLQGESLEMAVCDIVRATRRFAKRQMTWFRRETDVTWCDVAQLDSGGADVLRSLEMSGIGGI